MVSVSAPSSLDADASTLNRAILSTAELGASAASSVSPAIRRPATSPWCNSAARRDQRPAEAGRQKELLDYDFELMVVGDYS